MSGMIESLADRVFQLEDRVRQLEARMAGHDVSGEAWDREQVAKFLGVEKKTIDRRLSVKSPYYDATLAACSYTVGNRRRFDPGRVKAYRDGKRNGTIAA